MNKAVILLNCIAVFIWATNLFIYITRGKAVPLYVYAIAVVVIILFHIGIIAAEIRG